MVCYILERSAFNKLLGPIEEVWKLEALRKVTFLAWSFLAEVDRLMASKVWRMWTLCRVTVPKGPSWIQSTV